MSETNAETPEPEELAQPYQDTGQQDDGEGGEVTAPTDENER